MMTTPQEEGEMRMHISPMHSAPTSPSPHHEPPPLSTKPRRSILKTLNTSAHAQESVTSTPSSSSSGKSKRTSYSARLSNSRSPSHDPMKEIRPMFHADAIHDSSNSEEDGDEMITDTDETKMNDINTDDHNSTQITPVTTTVTKQSRKRVLPLHWDEENLARNECEKVPRMKVDEPKTPYHTMGIDDDVPRSPLHSGDEDENTEPRSPLSVSRTVRQPLIAGHDAADIQAMLTNGRAHFHRNQFVDTPADEEGDEWETSEEEPEEGSSTHSPAHRAKFEQLRKQHYHMGDLLKHSSNSDNDEEENGVCAHPIANGQ